MTTPAPIGSGQSAATSIVLMRAVGNDDPAADDDMVHVARGRREDDRRGGVSRDRSRRVVASVKATEVKSASAPTSMRPPSGQPRLR